MTLLKTLVVCLVLANVCYFLWEHGIAKSPDSVVAAASTPGTAAATPATLTLASESPEASRSETGGKAAGPLAAGNAGASAAPEATDASHAQRDHPRR